MRNKSAGSIRAMFEGGDFDIEKLFKNQDVYLTRFVVMLLPSSHFDVKSTNLRNLILSFSQRQRRRH
jgi:hypothetical protein